MILMQKIIQIMIILTRKKILIDQEALMKTIICFMQMWTLMIQIENITKDNLQPLSGGIILVNLNDLLVKLRTCPNSNHKMRVKLKKTLCIIFLLIWLSLS